MKKHFSMKNFLMIAGDIINVPLALWSLVLFVNLFWIGSIFEDEIRWEARKDVTIYLRLGYTLHHLNVEICDDKDMLRQQEVPEGIISTIRILRNEDSSLYLPIGFSAPKWLECYLDEYNSALDNAQLK